MLFLSIFECFHSAATHLWMNLTHVFVCVFVILAHAEVKQQRERKNSLHTFLCLLIDAILDGWHQKT